MHASSKSPKSQSQASPLALPLQQRIQIIAALMENHFFDLSKFPEIAGGLLFPQFWAFQEGGNRYSPVLALYLREVEAFLVQTKTPEFWRLRVEDTDRMPYSAAGNFYLNQYLDRAQASAFEKCRSMLARDLYQWRNDAEIRRDILIVFLHKNLEYLKRLYVLHQPHNQNVAATAQALETCFDAPENRAFMRGLQLSQWILAVWLPLQLRHSYCQDRQGRSETECGQAQEELFADCDLPTQYPDDTVFI